MADHRLPPSRSAESTFLDDLLSRSMGEIRADSHSILQIPTFADFLIKSFEDVEFVDHEKILIRLLYFHSGNLSIVTVIPINNLHADPKFIPVGEYLQKKVYQNIIARMMENNFMYLNSDLRLQLGLQNAAEYGNLLLDNQSCHTIILGKKDLNCQSRIENYISSDEFAISDIKNKISFHDYNDDSYIFIGWSYSLFFNGSIDRGYFYTFIGALVFMQSVWYHYKDTRRRVLKYSSELEGISQNNILKNFELFNDLNLKLLVWENWVASRRTDLTPKGKEIIEFIWKRWEMDILSKDLNHSFAGIRDIINISHQIKTIRSDRMQSDILFFIGCMSLFSLFGSVNDYFGLFDIIGIEPENSDFIVYIIDYGPSIVFALTLIIVISYMLKRRG